MREILSAIHSPKTAFGKGLRNGVSLAVTGLLVSCVAGGTGAKNTKSPKWNNMTGGGVVNSKTHRSGTQHDTIATSIKGGQDGSIRYNRSFTNSETECNPHPCGSNTLSSKTTNSGFSGGITAGVGNMADRTSLNAKYQKLRINRPATGGNPSSYDCNLGGSLSRKGLEGDVNCSYTYETDGGWKATDRKPLVIKK